MDDCLGIALARTIGRKLEAAGARVLPPRAGPRACDALGATPPLSRDQAREVARHAGATHLVQGTFDRDAGSLLLALQVCGDADPASADAHGPIATFQDIAERASLAVLKTLAIDADATCVARARETASFDAYLALARAQAAWLDGDVAAAEDEIAAASRLDPAFVDPHEAAAEAARAMGDSDRRLQALVEVARLHRDSGRSSEEAEAALALGDAFVEQGKWDEGVRHYEDASKIWEKLQDAKGVVKARSNVASVHLRRGDHARAIAEYERGLAQVRALGGGDAAVEAVLAFNLGFAHKVAGDLEAAARQFDEARRLGVEARDDAMIANAHNALGTIQDEQGDLEKALHQYRRAEEHLEGRADPVLLAGVKDNIGIVLRKRQELDDALVYSEQACALFEVHGDPDRVAIAYVNRAGLLLDLERDDEALPFAIAAHRIFTRLGSPSVGKTESLLEELGVDPDGIAVEDEGIDAY